MQALVESARRKGSALVVGLDPDPSRFPREIKALPGSECEKVERFCMGILEAVEPCAAVVKLQSAYFERLGPEGMRVYEAVIRASADAGMPTIADVKRGDIDSSARAYAEAHLRRFGATAVTVNPYMGADAVEPFVEEVRRLGTGGGVFALVATSNPSAEAIQSATSPPLYEVAARLVADLGETRGGSDFPDVGAVVGVTRPEVSARVREILPEALFLAPGFGAQGGGAEAVRPMLASGGRKRRGEIGAGVLVNSSRAVIYAHEKTGTDYREAAARAARDTRDKLRGVGVKF